MQTLQQLRMLPLTTTDMKDANTVKDMIDMTDLLT